MVGCSRKSGPLRYRLIHTEQHYDKNMTDEYFDQLGPQEPDINLKIGSVTHVEQYQILMNQE